MPDRMHFPAGASLVAVIASVAGCGGDDEHARGDPFNAARQGQTAAAARKAAPRWERLTRLSGIGDATESLAISPRALQWRVRWRCSSGRIALSTKPGSRSGPVRGGGECPGVGAISSSRLGAVRLRITATGRWSAEVEQQFDTALREAPFPEMRAAGARVLGRGGFYRMEGRGEGRALLYRLPDGRLAVRLERFRTPPTTGMFIWLSELPRPMTAKEVIGARPWKLGPLKSTLGEQNYLLPDALRRGTVRSVVIWDKPTQTPYVAASLVDPGGRAPSP